MLEPSLTGTSDHCREYQHDRMHGIAVTLAVRGSEGKDWSPKLLLGATVSSSKDRLVKPNSLRGLKGSIVTVVARRRKTRQLSLFCHYCPSKTGEIQRNQVRSKTVQVLGWKEDLLWIVVLARTAESRFKTAALNHSAIPPLNIVARVSSRAPFRPARAGRRR